MPQAGFGLRTSKDERPHTYALDCVATGNGVELVLRKENTIVKQRHDESEALFSFRQQNFISKQSLLFRKLATRVDFVVKPL
jgi:hypothetical protein